MSIIKVEHIGIAVDDIAQSDQLFALLLDRQPYKHESVEREGITTSFYDLGSCKIELLESTRQGSAIEKFIEKRGQGMHHLAFEVDDIVEEMERLRSAGFQLLNDTPQPGADNKLICFLHPKSTGGVLVELCQEIKAN